MCIITVLDKGISVSNYANHNIPIVIHLHGTFTLKNISVISCCRAENILSYSGRLAGSGDAGPETCSCNQQVNYVLEGTSSVRSNLTTDERCCDCCVEDDTCIGYTTVGVNESSVTCTTFTSVSKLTSTPVSGSDVSTAFLCKQNCSTLSKCSVSQCCGGSVNFLRWTVLYPAWRLVETFLWFIGSPSSLVQFNGGSDFEWK